jgi:hypothetical protein
VETNISVHVLMFVKPKAFCQSSCRREERLAKERNNLETCSATPLTSCWSNTDHPRSWLVFMRPSLQNGESEKQSPIRVASPPDNAQRSKVRFRSNAEERRDRRSAPVRREQAQQIERNVTKTSSFRTSPVCGLFNAAATACFADTPGADGN